MNIPSRILDLFAAMEPRYLDTLAPATRRRFAQFCRHWADLADPIGAPPPKRLQPKTGILHDLRFGRPE